MDLKLSGLWKLFSFNKIFTEKIDDIPDTRISPLQERDHSTLTFLLQLHFLLDLVFCTWNIFECANNCEP